MIFTKYIKQEIPRKAFEYCIHNCYHKSLDQDEVQAIKAISAAEKRKERVLAEIEVDDDSEEEVTTTVGEKDLSVSGR